MAKKLTADQWVDIETRLFKGEATAYALAKEYGISEGTIRARVNPKKRGMVNEAVTKLVEAKMAIAELPPSLQPHIDTMAETAIRTKQTLGLMSELNAKTGHKMAYIANLQSSKIDENAPDPDTVRLVHGLIETANKAAWQPLELLKASKGMDTAEQGAQMTLPVPVYKITHE